MPPRNPLGSPSAPRALSVGELARRIVRLLEEGIGSVTVEGEVSGVRIPSSGHCYFILKDDEAQINCVCFRGAMARAACRPVDGMKLEVRGRVTAYAPRSEYQVIVETMRPAGLGDLMRRYLELKEKLKAEGLFEPALKQPIPRLPRRIGLVTSPTGAALRDMLNVLGRRGRGLELFLSPSAVQGDAAPLELVAALHRLQRHARVEVIIMGRGGGSIEDLWAFNDERVVRAIAACPIPIISAVGHETDTTLADYAADLRAPTPSAAAELVSAHYGELTEHLLQLSRRLGRETQQRLAAARSRLDRCRGSWGLRSPRERLALAVQRLDDLHEQLRRAAVRMPAQRGERLAALTGRLTRANPQLRLKRIAGELAQIRARLQVAGPRRWRPQLAHDRATLEHLSQRLRQSTQSQGRQRRVALVNLTERLRAASPEAILSRGYSIVTHGRRDRLVTSPEQLRTGEVVRIRSAGGAWKAGVLPPGDDLFE